MALHEIEGTWEEVAQHAPELSGKRVRLTVLPAHLPHVDRDHFYFRSTPEEFRKALEEIAQQYRQVPPLPDEAFDRESIYAEDDGST
jgi:hypothetical protein